MYCSAFAHTSSALSAIESGELSGCLVMEAEPQLKPILRFHFSGACFSRCSEVSSVAAVSSEQEQSSFSRSLSPGSYTWEESDAELDTEILERKACGGGGCLQPNLRSSVESRNRCGSHFTIHMDLELSEKRRRKGEGMGGKERKGEVHHPCHDADF